MRWIDDLISFVDSEFSPNWKDELIQLNPNKEELKKSLLEKENGILPKIYELLCFSVIEGEHINQFTEFQEKITQLHSKLSNIQNSIIINDDENFTLKIIFDEFRFLHSVNKALFFYKRIGINIEKYLNNPEKTFVIDYSGEFEGFTKYFKEKENNLEEDLFDLFTETLILSRKGFLLNDNIEEFSFLLDRIDSLKHLKNKLLLENYAFSEIIELLNEICLFYQRKIIIRKSQNLKNLEEKYLFELKEIDFKLEDHSFIKDYFVEWDDYCQNHYLSEKNEERKSRLMRDFKDDDQLNDFKFIHSKIKYYKDIKPNIEKLEEISAFFNDYNSKSKFETLSLNISYSYLFNNILSTRIKNLKYDELDDMLIKIKKSQETFNVNNYFPYYKICKFLKKEIENDFSKIKIGKEVSIELTKNKITALKTALKTYKLKLNWSKKHLNFAFQLPFDECKVSTSLIYNGSDTDIHIFIPSSFTLPLNFDKYDNFLIKTENYLLFSENECKSLENYILMNIKIKEREDEIHNVLSDQSKKNIELLGIFSAIIALLFQGAYTSQSNTAFENKFLTFIIMFVVLAFFLIMLRAFISNKKQTNEDLLSIRVSLYLIVPVLLIIIFILFKSI